MGVQLKNFVSSICHLYHALILYYILCILIIYRYIILYCILFYIMFISLTQNERVEKKVLDQSSKIFP